MPSPVKKAWWRSVLRITHEVGYDFIPVLQGSKLRPLNHEVFCFKSIQLISGTIYGFTYLFT